MVDQQAEIFPWLIEWPFFSISPFSVSLSPAPQHIDGNLAVESATTRTISRITKGQRALSYHHVIGNSTAQGLMSSQQQNRRWTRNEGGGGMGAKGIVSGRSQRQQRHKGFPATNNKG